MERSLKPQESSLTKRNGAHENVFNGKRAGVRACVRVFDDGECRRAAASSRVFFIPFAAVAAAGCKRKAAGDNGHGTISIYV
jgi:hypothetical protein